MTNVIDQTWVPLGGAIYYLTPVLWVLIAATRSSGELFFNPARVDKYQGFDGNLRFLRVRG